MKEGLLIVLYGINNLGKTTQAIQLVEALNSTGLIAEHIKYPIYDLTPTGPQINAILRSDEKQTITEKDFQTLYIKNRKDFQPQLCKKLAEGINVVAEDYIGTGIAWGWAKGADLEWLIEANKGLLKADIEILIDGERFLEAREAKHQHESNDQLTDKCRQCHLELAARFNWHVINANQTIEEVHQDILKVIASELERIKNLEI